MARPIKKREPGKRPGKQSRAFQSVAEQLHPHVREWFFDTFGAPSLPQERGWPAIASGSHTLILAPTGTGKTLAAFLWELNALIVEGTKSPLANGVYLVYVSPLKALNNDIQRNLEQPLAQLKARFEQAGEAFPEIRVAVRTGDTPQSQRAKMIRKSPHILITTPESLNIMLTTVRGRAMFATTRAVIVDEIHAVAGTKRGAHLAVTLERLDHTVAASSRAPQRIGLSATQRPLEEIAKFLAWERDVAIVDCGIGKELRLSIESPVEDLGKVDGTVWPSVAKLVVQHIQSARTTLVFVNNRAQAERIAARINELAEEELALPYHGSLSRERRMGLEQRLKDGELRALVATSSLELGIDIGSVNLVIQLQSPKRVSAGLQRVGRAGHALGLPSVGVFIPTFRDDAMEIAAELEARIVYDRASQTISGTRGSRMTAVISGGTIPDRGLYTVNLPDRTRIGELDEEFVHESRVGDVFQLGSSTWRINVIERDRVVVTPAPGVPARMPFWHGEFSARSFALSARVGELRHLLTDGADEKTIQREYLCDAATAQSLLRYVAMQRAATHVVPDNRTLVVEHFRDEVGSVRVVIHAAFGGRVNAPWGMALGRRARELLGADVQVQTTDDGIMLRMPELASLPPVHSLLRMTPDEVEHLVMEEVGASSLFGARFRMNAGRALLLPRGKPNARMPLWLQRLKALDLLQVVQQFPSFPILVETYREVLQDAFDMQALKSVLRAIDEQQIPIHVVQTQTPSPFSASLQFGFVIDWLYGDDTPRAEQRAALLSLDRALLDDVMGNVEHDDETLRALWEIIDRRKEALAQTDPQHADEYGSGEGGRRGLLAKYISLVGPTTAQEIQTRYGWPLRWIERQLEEWHSRGRLVVGKFRPTISDREYLSAKTADIARRRALVALRKQIEAVEFAQYAYFLHRWQHIDPRDQLDGPAGVAIAMQQLYGVAPPGLAWERDYLKSRIRQYEPAWLSEWLAQGDTVWAGSGNYSEETNLISLTRIRFFERGTGNLWLAPIDTPPLSEHARRVLETIVGEGASLLVDLQIATSLSPLLLREAIRELVAFGLVTNDTAEAFRQIIQWQPLTPEPSYDPERWLPESFLSTSRSVRQRRANVRRLPKWHRPDKDGALAAMGWTGRWSLVYKASTLGPSMSEEERASAIVHQWLTRYGIVSRDWWRRERPPVSWRSMYHELKRLEFRGDVRRGYFVQGLAGAQFALPDAVEQLRALSGESDVASQPFVVIATSDPANPYALPLEDGTRDPLARPRGAGALLVVRGGRIALSVEGRGKRVVAADWLSADELMAAKHALKHHLRGERGSQSVL